jgi:hypothetical protein
MTVIGTHAAASCGETERGIRNPWPSAETAYEWNGPPLWPLVVGAPKSKSSKGLP